MGWVIVGGSIPVQCTFHLLSYPRCSTLGERGGVPIQSTYLLLLDVGFQRWGVSSPMHIPSIILSWMWDSRGGEFPVQCIFHSLSYPGCWIPEVGSFQSNVHSTCCPILDVEFWKMGVSIPVHIPSVVIFWMFDSRGRELPVHPIKIKIIKLKISLL